MLLDKTKDFFFSSLSKFKVVDKKGQKLGTVGDALFQFEKGTIKFHSLILFGSRIEEKLEGVGIKENIDPIIPIDNIVEEDIDKKTFTINLSKEDVKTTNKSWKAPEGTFHYLKFKKVPVMDKDNKKFGRTIDIFIQSTRKFKLILGGSWLEEFLEDIRVFPDKDLILPSSRITEIKINEILTDVHERDLITTLADKSLEEKGILKSDYLAFTRKNLNYS